MEIKYISELEKYIRKTVCDGMATLKGSFPENFPDAVAIFQKSFPELLNRITSYNKLYLSIGKDGKEKELYATDYYVFFTTYNIIPKSTVQQKNMHSVFFGETPQENRVVVESVPELVYTFNESLEKNLIEKVKGNKYPYAPFFENIIGNHPFSYGNLKRVTSEIKSGIVKITPDRKKIIDNFHLDILAGRHLI